MTQVQVDWAEGNVKALLGQPDDFWPPNDSRQYVMAGDSAWCYGTNGHHTLPTLGYIVFRRGKVLYTVGGGEPPSTKVVGESELVDALRRMYRPPNQGMWTGSDPQRQIQVANLLIPKGRDKALAILEEYSRLARNSPGDEWLFWLVRVLFTSSRPGGVFPVPAIGGIIPAPPKDPRRWPTHPVLVVDDIPVCLFRGAMLGGFPEPFGWYLRDHRKEWTIRTKPLTPPDDPFPSFVKLIASQTWPFPKGDPHRASYTEDEAAALREILTLVRTAYRPNGDGDVAYMTGLNLDRYHKAFLALGGHWDAVKQMYVRKDGSALQDPRTDFPQYQYTFANISRLRVAVTFSRTASHNLDYDVSCEELGKSKIANAIMVVEDPGSGAELYWTGVNDPSSAASWETTAQKLLARPPHKPAEGGRSVSSGFPFESGRRIRFVIRFQGKRYVSPAFKP